MPEREPVMNNDSVITIAATKYIKVSPPSGSEHHTSQARAPLPRSVGSARTNPPAASPRASGVAMSIQPAK